MSMEPHSMFGYMGRYFWVFCLVASGFQYRSARRRLLSAHQKFPGKARAALAYLRWYTVGSTLPWVVMGCGEISGSTPTVWYYFRPQDGNPYVLAWIGLWLFASLLFTCWVFLANGARKIMDLNLTQIFGSKERSSTSTFKIKLFAALGPLFVLLWIFMAVSMNAPLPKG